MKTVPINSAEIEADVDAIIRHSRMQPSSVEDRAAPEQRTVGLEVLTPELREAADAERTAEEPEYMQRVGRQLLAGARVAVVLREGAKAAVGVVDTDWSKLRAPLLLARLIQHAKGQADECGAELLMPTPDVLAALAGRPVGRYTATVESRWNVVQPGWLVLVDTLVAGQADVEWLTVDWRKDCTDPACEVATREAWSSCAVVAVRGQGVRHREAYRAIHVRIPADTAVER
ncbi:hypothetical protein ABT297_04235 [Dactylosporangium sp. NPDC000555]|uniref:hypothetical protein n=1 Tax=Dactylosporangium sp. NPDC000555 TaxID=3154260 RepID=UPI00331D4D2F